jgi:hypothetical protein
MLQYSSFRVAVLFHQQLRPCLESKKPCFQKRSRIALARVTVTIHAPWARAYESNRQACIAQTGRPADKRLMQLLLLLLLNAFDNVGKY